MMATFRACAPAARADLKSRFGTVFDGADERAKQALLNFERVWAARGSNRSRYSNGVFPVLYTAADETVAFVEKGFWVYEIFLKPLARSKALPDYYLYKVSINGRYREYTVHDEPSIVHPTDYSYCNNLGKAAVADGLSYLIVPSARKFGGICMPVFLGGASTVRETETEAFSYIFDHSTDKLSVRWRGSVNDIEFDDVFGSL